MSVFLGKKREGMVGNQNLSSPWWPPTADGAAVVPLMKPCQEPFLIENKSSEKCPLAKSFGRQHFCWWKWWEEVLFRLGKHKTMEKQTNTFPVPRFGRWHSKTEDTWFIALAIEKSLPTCSMIWLNFMRILWNHLAAGRLAPKNATGWVMNLENGDGAWNCNRSTYLANP